MKAANERMTSFRHPNTLCFDVFKLNMISFGNVQTKDVQHEPTWFLFFKLNMISFMKAANEKMCFEVFKLNMISV